MYRGGLSENRSKYKKKLGNFNLDINFSSDNLRTGILGRSGCGKSVTLKAIAGIITPDSGRIVINNKVLYDSDKNINLKPQERKVGYLFQNYALFPTMTVEKNISVVIKIKKIKRKSQWTYFKVWLRRNKK